MNWQPITNKFIRNLTLKDTLYKNENMFYILYSNDISYRGNVYEGIGKSAEQIYDSLFSFYKSKINSFLVNLAEIIG